MWPMQVRIAYIAVDHASLITKMHTWYSMKSIYEIIRYLVHFMYR